MPDTLPEAGTTTNITQAPRVTLAAMVKDQTTGAVYVHKDMAQVIKPWADEEHVGPVDVHETFGDVESWAAYVKTYAMDDPYNPLLTWNSAGLKAVLDYHTNSDEPGRTTWIATAPFTPSIQWTRWAEFANGRAHSQRETVEKLEDFGTDVVDPDPAKLMEMMRSLRASVNARSSAEMAPDGSTFVSYTNEKQVRGVSQNGDVTLPAELTIRIPVLKGHLGENGLPVVYDMRVRMRASVGDDSHLTFRFSIPKAEIVMEDVYADRVAAARTALGEKFSILRAGG